METLFKVKTSGTDRKKCALKSWLWGYDYIKATDLMHEYNIYTNMRSGVGGGGRITCHFATFSVTRFSSLCLVTWVQRRQCAHGRDKDKEQGWANLVRPIQTPHEVGIQRTINISMLTKNVFLFEYEVLPYMYGYLPHWMANIFLLLVFPCVKT
jgi:hypothetical protein